MKVLLVIVSLVRLFSFSTEALAESSFTWPESAIQATEDVVQEYFDASWSGDLLDCVSPRVRVNIEGVPESQEDGTTIAKIYYRCKSQIVWNEFEVCEVVFDNDPDTGKPDASTFQINGCDI